MAFTKTPEEIEGQPTVGQVTSFDIELLHDFNNGSTNNIADVVFGDLTIRFGSGTLYPNGVQILWKGVEIGATDPGFNMGGWGFSKVPISVDTSGNVLVQYPDFPATSRPAFNVSATIPNGEWLTTPNQDEAFVGTHNNGTLNFRSGTVSDVPVCFTRGTLIKTADGEVPVEELQVGDRVLTLDSNYQEIRWIGSNKLDAIDLEVNPRLKPIRIKAHALGPGYPEKDLLVSPQHRMLVRSTIAERMFNAVEVLIPANKLLVIDGIDVEQKPKEVEYFHILFDAHQIVWANGALSESLYTGPEALKAVSLAARKEIETLFPEICDPDFEPLLARDVPEKGKLMKKLAQRHKANGKPLYSELKH